MTESRPLRILVVDDDEEIVANTKELLETQPVSDASDMASVTTETSFEAALELLAREEFDLLVLDVRDQGATEEGFQDPGETGSDATEADVGLRIFEQVRATRFVPIIFYTSLPNLVEEVSDPGAPFVDVVSKNDSDSTRTLRERVRTVFNSTLPAIHRALLEHVERVVRDFMGGFVQDHWSELSTPPRKGDVAHLLLRRLALSLAEGAPVLTQQLAGEAIDLQGDTVHPMRFYVIPPLATRATGDILRLSSDSAATSWYVVLTPACDLVPDHTKADFVTLAKCVQFRDRDEYDRFCEDNPDPTQPPSEVRKELRRLMTNNHGQADRLAYLPAAWGLPDLLVDFQQVQCISYSDLTNYECLASLDSPYAEWLIQKFVRFVGRIGVPDLNVEVAIARLRSVP